MRTFLTECPAKKVHINSDLAEDFFFGVLFRVLNKKKGFRFLGSLDFIGATNRIRTYDPLITNEMLCQLSYSGKYSYIIFTSPIVVNTFFKLF